METHKTHWLYAVAPTVAMIVAYAFLAIGLTMFFSSWLKLEFYDAESNVYYDSCQYDYAKPVPVGASQVERSPEEIQSCLERMKVQNFAQYAQQKRDNMIDGAVFFGVGVIFWFLARGRRNKQS